MAGPASKAAVCVNLLYTLTAPQCELNRGILITQQAQQSELCDFSFWGLPAPHTEVAPLQHTLQSPTSGRIGWKVDGLTMGVCGGMEYGAVQCILKHWNNFNACRG